MSWIVLVLSGLFEAVWATALGKIEGPQSVGAITAFVLGSAVSLGGLWWAMKDLPTGTAYAVWTATGASLTVAWAMFTRVEPVSLAKILLLVGIVTCVVGLKVLA